MSSRILITLGEPAGIGPDIIIQLAQQAWPTECIVIADPQLLQDRAQQLKLPIKLHEVTIHSSTQPGCINILPVQLAAPVQAGQLNPQNAPYVIKTLELAAEHCLTHQAQAIVTGPVHKSVINQSGIAFSGHTEFFAHYANVPHTVMLFVVEDKMRVALATTHLPLAKVPQAITPQRLTLTLDTLYHGLSNQFHIVDPRIAVCGLNPHAGEGGYLGREEIDVIQPIITHYQQQGWKIDGPFAADTLFTTQHAQSADAILAMYHDQALPIVKYLSFGHAVNVTLGLPFIRTSVDHGTAIDIAGQKGRADPSSMRAALALAMRMVQHRHS
ncbi:MAG: 4-hydroxythreonine-4-phosphate dehydrogenase PdxA [Gammaproteobacteria bacterium RIFCSPHIGHO2_12_FULL_41_20]|nr:MAG: 4-hydroxythreonine-4-phosphate dehydrogenase PdxA [Gammaproteobacteria bacterium RIFCSPHIGHO2_12_FULL_41_20]